jgi:hypothetical protein
MPTPREIDAAVDRLTGRPAQFGTAEPEVTLEMLEAARKADFDGIPYVNPWEVIYRAMRALEPMPVTPGLWSDVTYRALLAERDALRSENALLRATPPLAGYPVEGVTYRWDAAGGVWVIDPDLAPSQFEDAPAATGKPLPARALTGQGQPIGLRTAP